MKFRVFWDILPCSQIDVDIDLTTRQYIPEDSEFHTSRCENLKSHIYPVCCMWGEHLAQYNTTSVLLFIMICFNSVN
jgi:hypothetical protein